MATTRTSQDTTSSSPESRSTTMTTPDHSTGGGGGDDDDIWETEDNAVLPSDPASQIGGNRHNEMLSDLPTLRRQHMTDGYREGLGVGKARVMQQAFDSGYPIGIAIAQRVGIIFGALEGFIASPSINLFPEMKERARDARKRAYTDLAVSELLKDVDEDALVMMTGEAKGEEGGVMIPAVIEEKLKVWEVTADDVSKANAKLQRIIYVQNGHEWRDMCGQAKERLHG